MTEEAKVKIWNGLQCQNCHVWMPISHEKFQIEKENLMDCCENPDFKQEAIVLEEQIKWVEKS